VPDTRSHRGPHPEDHRLFALETLGTLREAVADLSWLLSRGYPNAGAQKLVGDRYQLAARQRTAVARCACSDADLARRRKHEVPCEALAGKPLALDGYNVLTTVEAALAGGVILAACDGTYRDMASMHGSFRRVSETRPALELIGRGTAAFGVSACLWLLDRPVSNSGRLKRVMIELAKEHGWDWTIELVPNPDAVLVESDRVAATADSAVMDRCPAWCNLGREIVARFVPGAVVLDLAVGSDRSVSRRGHAAETTDDSPVKAT
jgi:hypothetical protein